MVYLFFYQLANSELIDQFCTSSPPLPLSLSFYLFFFFRIHKAVMKAYDNIHWFSQTFIYVNRFDAFSEIRVISFWECRKKTHIRTDGDSIRFL